MAKKQGMRIKLSDLAFIVFAIFVAGFVIGTTLAPQQKVASLVTGTIGDERSVAMFLPAVDSEGTGVVARLYTSVKPGTGKILLDTSSVLNFPDTQLAGRTAAHVAADYAGVDMNTIDVVYTLDVNASIIEGPSSGAAMAVSVILAMKNQTAPDDVAITGTINSDGTIGRVGGVLEKARAVKDLGVTTFLVPEGQVLSEDSERVRACSFIGTMEVCKVNYKTRNVNLGAQTNLTVHEVSNIAEALAYFNATR